MKNVWTLLTIALSAALPSLARAAEGGGSKPLIDPPLVLTQIVGFILMVLILRATAWGPLIGLLEDRRQRIAGEFEEAKRRQAEADELKAKYEQELKGIEARARARLQEAVAHGQQVAAEIKAQAQADAVARLRRAEDEVESEREKAKVLLKEQVASLSIRAAEKILRERLDEPAQRRLVDRFIDEAGGVS